MTTMVEWAGHYGALVAALSEKGRSGAFDGMGLFLCGMSTCIDARVDMHAMEPLLAAQPGTPAHALITMLKGRVARGIGGETRFEWPEGPAWLRTRLHPRHALGGTGAQAAWVLSKLGVRSLVALEDRYALMLSQIPDGVLIAEDGEAKPAGAIRVQAEDVPEIYIFEYTAGRPVGDVTPTRSSRIIVRFEDRGVQVDEAFEALSAEIAGTAAAGLISGLNDEAPENVPAASRRVFDMARGWRKAGLDTVHFELAGYTSQVALSQALDESIGAITSLGMSHSELIAMDAGAEMPMAAMIALGERLGLQRVCIHADNWAASVVTGDPEREREALMTGCALAQARAAAGRPVAEITLHPDARFEPLPFPERHREGRWTFVACPSPYLEKPVTTLGLGDSFTAGCLLVLGQRPESGPDASYPTPAGAHPSNSNQTA
ncbi:ADP-dependent glucokinase/phosphofructokinase [Ensifer soli]|uniref:ADP-dependent glucokinase/phosphofructokinase n=1 Tax=Ciceribacter sp. sgz301302 TaxID=3342379 RepID=UPI0035B8E890